MHISSSVGSVGVCGGADFNQYVKNLDCPILDIGQRQGNTYYIDFIKFEEVTSPIMKGIDKFSRPFIVIKVNGKLTDGSNIQLFQTFFQRYTDENLWMGCGHYGLNLITTYGGMKSDQFKLIIDLINGKVCQIEDINTQELINCSVNPLAS